MIIFNLQTEQIEEEIQISEFSVNHVYFDNENLYFGDCYNKLNFVNLNKFLQGKQKI